MHLLTLSLFAQPSAARKAVSWLYHLGGPGLVLLGLVDNSLVPVTGSMDVVTILLAAQNRAWWPYYSLMATIGSVIGGYLTYRLAGKGGEGRLQSLLSRSLKRRIKTIFEKWRFGSIVVPALLPPPFPMVPFLLAAGATQYPRNQFLAALAIGRGIRYSILGLLGFLYGRWIITLIRQNERTIIWLGVILVAISVAAAFFRFRRESALAR